MADNAVSFGQVMKLFSCRCRGIGSIAVKTAMCAGIILADVFAENATAGFSLTIILGRSKEPHLKHRVIGSKSGYQFRVYAVIVLNAIG